MVLSLRAFFVLLIWILCVHYMFFFLIYFSKMMLKQPCNKTRPLTRKTKLDINICTWDNNRTIWPINFQKEYFSQFLFSSLFSCENDKCCIEFQNIEYSFISICVYYVSIITKILFDRKFCCCFFFWVVPNFIWHIV